MKYKKLSILIFLLMFFSCDLHKKKYTLDIKHAIPINSDLIIKIHDWRKMKTKIESFAWWKELKNTNLLNENLNLLEHLNDQYQIAPLFDNRNIYLSSISDINVESELILITSINDFEQNKSIKLLQAIMSHQNNPIIYEGVQINNIKINTSPETKKDVFFSTYKNIFLLSFSKIIIEKSIRQLVHNNSIFQHNIIEKLDQNLPKYSDVNILVKTQFLENVIDEKNVFLNSNGWSWFDVELENTHIILNGVTNRGNIKYLDSSNYSDAKESRIQHMLPRHIKRFYKYQINNNSDLNEIINTISHGPYTNKYQLSYHNWQPLEISIAHNKSEAEKTDYIIFKTNEKNKCFNHLKSYHDNDFSDIQYLDYVINKLKTQNMSNDNWLKKITESWSEKYYINVQDYIIICHNIKELKSMINNLIANQTIGKSKALQIIENKLGVKSHTTSYFNLNNLKKNWKTGFNSIVVKNIASQEYFFNSLIFLHDHSKIINPTLWSFNLKHETHYTPQIVTNHYTQESEIITQDIENNLYLINSKGKKLWMKKIGNSILGDIHQIDMFNNNKLQYIFNTKDSIYVMDRKGRHVAPFPIKSKYTMSIPLALFDYDNNENYRILVPMKNELFMYDKKGKIVSGWEFTSTNSNIITTPEHYQVLDKDYIIISEENGKIHLLNRKGQSRAVVNEKIQRSKDKSSLIQGNNINDSKLIVKEISGKMKYIYLNGLVDSLQIQNLNQNAFYEKNNNYTIIVNKSQLIYSSNTNKFEYNFKNSKLGDPKVFFHNDSILVAIQNLSENLIYLFNDNGKLHIKPFFGTTDFNITKSYSNQNLNMIVGSYEGVVYNYVIN